METPELDLELLKEVTIKMLGVDNDYLPFTLKKSVVITQFLQTGRVIGNDEFQSLLLDDLETSSKHF